MRAQSSRRHAAGCALASLLLATGCAVGAPSARILPTLGPPGPAVPAEAGPQVPITTGAVAAVALSILPGGTRTRAATGKRSVALTYLGTEGRPGAQGSESIAGPSTISVDVGVEPNGKLCPATPLTRCVELEGVGSQGSVLQWGETEPREGPGFVEVRSPRDDGSVVWARSRLDRVDRDPREMHLVVGISTLTEVATDPRLSLRTDEALVNAGRQVRRFLDEPYSLMTKKRPQTAEALAAQFLVASEQGENLGAVVRSPWANRVGPRGRAVRMTFDRGIPWAAGGTVDLMVSRRPLAALGSDPCAKARFAGHCERQDFGGLRAWVPSSEGERGVIWYVVRGEDDSWVTLRYTGETVPDSSAAPEVGARSGYQEATVAAGLGLTTYGPFVRYDPRPDAPSATDSAEVGRPETMP